MFTPLERQLRVEKLRNRSRRLNEIGPCRPFLGSGSEVASQFWREVHNSLDSNVQIWR